MTLLRENMCPGVMDESASRGVEDENTSPGVEDENTSSGSELYEDRDLNNSQYSTIVRSLMSCHNTRTELEIMFNILLIVIVCR